MKGTKLLKGYTGEIRLLIFVSLLVSLLLVFPIGLIFGHLSGDFFEQVVEVLTSEFFLNTLLLLLGTVVLTLLLGVFPAWIVSYYDFRGKNAVDLLLMIPISLPGYISAYAWHGFLGMYGTWHAWTGNYYEINHLGGAIVIMASVLYPYVYLAARASFRYQAGELILASRTLGAGVSESFFRVALPLSWPAIAAGSILVIMEVINDYGVVSYFGVPTVTSFLIDEYEPGNHSRYINVASITILLVLGILVLRARLIKGRNYSVVDKSTIGLEPNPKTPVGVKFLVWLPVLLGLLIPLTQLGIYGAKTMGSFKWSDLSEWIFNSVKLAFWGALFCVIVSFLMALIHYVVRFRGGSALRFLGSLGYAVPGAVLGLGVLLLIGGIRKAFGVSLFDSMLVLIFAYVVRFVAVANSQVESAFLKLPANLAESSRSLGVGVWKIIFQVYFPLLKRPLLVALLVCMVDIFKELPLTRMFQLFNFETLAVKTFDLMETEGAVEKAAVPSLIIVILSVLSVLIIHWVDRKKQGLESD